MEFSKGSGTGNSAFRAEFMKEALKCGVDELEQDLLVHFTFFFVPESVIPFLCGAALCALLKKCGGIRPVAVGEFFRRLVSKIICKVERNNAAEFFMPLQVGVGVKGGSEIAVKSVLEVINRFGHISDQEYVMLKIDFENAFNMVDRSAFLRKVRLSFPKMYNWVHLLYSQNSFLLFGDKII